MNEGQIRAGKYRVLSFETPRSRSIYFVVKSDVPVSTYIVDDVGLEDFENGDSVPSYGGATRRRNHKGTVMLSGLMKGDPWYLVIHNHNDVTAHIRYEVMY